jgi:HEAT repeat protein
VTTLDSAAAAPALAVARGLGAAVLAVGDDGPAGLAVDSGEAMVELERLAQDATAVIEAQQHDVLRIGGSMHPAHSGALGALAAAFRARGVGALTLRPGATRAGLEGIVAFLAARDPHPPAASWGIQVVPSTSAGWAATQAFDAAYVVEPAALLVATRSALAESNGLALAACARALSATLARAGRGSGRVTLAQVGRLLARPEGVALLARYVTDGAGDAAIHEALGRAGDYAVHILLDALADAETLTARRACFDAIAAIDMGMGPLLDALRDERWFVVRNAALLLGELDATGTESALAAALTHADGRVRAAVAATLLKRRTPAALVALQRAVRDPSPQVRLLAARAYLAGVEARPSSTLLVAALDVERDERVAREQIAALGRLATPDAIQRLVRLLSAGPGQASSPAQQVAAMEALVGARGDAAVVTVRRLVDAADPDVRAAAQSFLKAVGTR